MKARFYGQHSLWVVIVDMDNILRYKVLGIYSSGPFY